MMAALSYPSTSQTTNRCRVCRVIVDPVTELFRDLLRHHVLETDFPKKLTLEKDKILRCVRNPLHISLLYPKNGSFCGGYDQFDLTLLYTLLRNICGIKEHRNGWGKPPDPGDRSLSANIEKIRIRRNECLGHMPKMSLSDIDFAQTWSEIRHIVSEIEKHLGNSTKYVDAVDFMETDTMDPEQEKKYIHQRNSQQKLIEDITDTQDQQSIEIQEQKNDLKRKGNELQKLDKRIKAVETVNPEKQNILSNTEKVLEEHCSLETYVRTSSVQATIDMLQKNHIAILTGKSGDGKTTTAYQVLLELSQGRPDHQLNSAVTHELYERNEMSKNQEKPNEATDGLFAGESGRTQVQRYVPVIITSPDQWNRVINPDGHFIVLLDDIFGLTNFDPVEFEKWRKLLDMIFSSSKRGNVYLIFGIRSHILEHVRREMQKGGLSNLNEKYEVDFSSKFNLRKQEKLKLVEAFERCYKYPAKDLIGRNFEFYIKQYGEDSTYQLSDQEKEDIANSDPFYGFPQTCSLFFKRKESYQNGSDFFKRPNEMLFLEIEKMRKGNMETKIDYCILSYVFIHGSMHMINYDMEAMQDICQKMRLDNIREIDVEDAVERLKKSALYLKMAPENENVYTFTHQTLLETVMVSFGRLAPELVIKTCSRKNLYELIRTQNGKRIKGEVILTIPGRLYSKLAERMLDEVECTSKEAFIDSLFYFVFHPVLFDPEFVEALLKMPKTEKYHQKTSDILASSWKSFTVKKSILFNPVLILEMLEEYGPHEDSENWEVESSHDFDFSVTREGLLECLEDFIWECNDDCVSLLVRYICKHWSLHDILQHQIKCLFPDLQQEKKIVGMNIVHYFILNGWEYIVYTILKVHTPENSELNWTCAHFAAFGGKFSLLKKFVQNFEGEEKTEEGYSVLQAALLGIIFSDHNEKLRPIATMQECYFQSKTQPVNIEFANDEGYKNILHFLYESRKSRFEEEIAEIVDKFGNGVFHYLVIHENSKVLNLLLQLGKDSVHHRSDTDLPTPLHMAVYLGRADFVKALWEAGVRTSPSDMSLTDTLRSGKERSGWRVTSGWSTSISTRECHSTEERLGPPVFSPSKLKLLRFIYVDFGSIDDYNKTEEILETLEKKSRCDFNGVDLET